MRNSNPMRIPLGNTAQEWGNAEQGISASIAGNTTMPGPPSGTVSSVAPGLMQIAKIDQEGIGTRAVRDAAPSSYLAKAFPDPVKGLIKLHADLLIRRPALKEELRECGDIMGAHNDGFQAVHRHHSDPHDFEQPADESDCALLIAAACFSPAIGGSALLTFSQSALVNG
eukprot:CAMPEP_0117665536 /NCGR_PEP_ID=MMETSP0804-20121206/9867_1 /TAXON_ID=1074897 /ORGANISM="Tetraselmis astigmatica, Strain CCMP880" /LENGTH=169 /DNA_ID=CAMNT_0005472965 /DNA_START=480 /DNA_END=990 /DNA_ORIENTATION=+